MDLLERLQLLAQLRRTLEETKAQYEAMREQIIPDEVKEELAALDQEMLPTIHGLEEAIRNIELEVRKEAEALEPGASFKSDSVTLSVGIRRHVNPDELDALADRHPELADEIRGLITSRKFVRLSYRQ